MLSFRKANIEDLQLYFVWANDRLVREHSYNSNKIDIDAHSKWFTDKLQDKSCLMLLFQNEEDLNIGQVRIQKQNNNESIIGISIALEFRGRGYAKEMIQMASDYFLNLYPDSIINAFIKEENHNSKYAFEKSGFEFIKNVIYEDCKSFLYKKKI